ncbi:MipA/OmpV family protein [Kangiella sediminilitoris]|uniref:Uncharacterized protein n=1 Tax=Kangiella sediminilitoris TaxID=1144748 RepID=A0A1B3BCA0_9GAMM|nr:MipA/OmpV family protein [Kangiella sediminilitoris]AOE50428.1 hypothetical protein KS2013_1719 [Kangiella sediminilitoris]
MRKPFFIASIFWLLAATVHAETTEIEIEVIESDPDVVEQVENDDPHNSKTNSGEWNISLSLGYGQVESIISNVDDFDLYLLPNISYYGESFFLENTTMGYSLYEDEDFYLDIVGKLNEDGIYFNLDDFGVFSALGTSPPLRDPRIPPPRISTETSPIWLALLLVMSWQGWI